MPELTRESIIEAAKDAATRFDGPLSKTKFIQLTGISEYYIYRLFPVGGWSDIRTLAGIERHPNDNKTFSDNQLLEEYHRVVSSLGKIPAWPEFASLANVSDSVIRRRFGTNKRVRERYRKWLETHHPHSNILKLLPVEFTATSDIAPSPSPIKKPLTTRWQKNENLEFGAPINFRGLRHAPINEQGVVYLFGMVSRDLGLIVEAVQSAFPDCEAKRCIDSRLNRWQRVRIEFEYLSRNFRDHGHEPNGCDLIICWEHNWPDCPLEVIELKTVIGELAG